MVQSTGVIYSVDYQYSSLQYFCTCNVVHFYFQLLHIILSLLRFMSILSNCKYFFRIIMIHIHFLLPALFLNLVELFISILDRQYSFLSWFMFILVTHICSLPVFFFTVVYIKFLVTNIL